MDWVALDFPSIDATPGLRLINSHLEKNFAVVTRLANGNYVILTTNWSSSKGAITWIDGSRPSSLTISAANSLLGSASYDFANASIKALGNGHYVVTCPSQDSGTMSNTGAILWGNGNGGTVGLITASNSFTGRLSNDALGNSATIPQSDGAFAVISKDVTSEGLLKAGAVTLSDGDGPFSGYLNPSNSLFGGTVLGGSKLNVDYSSPLRKWAIGAPAENRVTLFSYATPATPRIGLELDGGLHLTSSAMVDFGEVAIGSVAEKTITIVNRGSSPLYLAPPSLTSAEFSLANPVPQSELPAGAQTTITLRFTPSFPGPVISPITLGSNDPGDSLFALNLRGSGLPIPGLPFGMTIAPSILTALPSGGTQVAFHAIPGRPYVVQRSLDLTTWPYLRQVVAAEDGTILFTDTESGNQKAFYRLRAK